ncbi:TraV family lipoprotein [Thauera butanivorans]|uniref:TraV family lipoprotein n=1 Tax=Thauera butanivorans TaxID=86174 RepID=UPI000838783D|nr:TraV family lipoprotein [Thauera butanivorans]
MKRFILLGIAVLAGLSGCATDLTGVGGSDSHKCPMPEGGACRSIIENYADGDGPSVTRGRQGAGEEGEAPVRIVTLAPGFGDALDGAPLMTTPRVLRVYIAPWRDSDDNLMDGRRVYTRIDEGRWRIEHFDASVRREAGAQPRLKPPADRTVGAGQDESFFASILGGRPTSAAAPAAPAAPRHDFPKLEGDDW